MSHRLRHTLVLVAIVVGVSAHLAAQTVPMPAEYRPVRDYIEQGLAAGLSPSVAVAVVKDGRVIWAEGFGLADRERGIKATADTIYLLASGSKPLTATGVMALVDRNLIDLDRPANLYLPGAKLRAYAGSPDDITVRRLLSHSSGLPAYFDYIYPGDTPLSPDETIRRYGFALTPPGSQYAYSNLNFALLTYIVEAVTKTPWRQFQEKTVYDPLGMPRTSDRVRPGHEQEAAAPYLQDAAGRFLRVPDYVSGHQGASHIRSTANDLARFALMHLQGGAVGSVRILSDASVRAMQKVTAENPPGSAQGYGFGWMISPALGSPTVRHDGNMPGVATVLRVYPEDRAATVVLTNTSTATMVIAVTTELGRVILNRPAPTNAAPSPPLPPPPPPPAAPRIPPDVLEGFVGTWQGTLAHHDGDVAVRLVISSKGDQAEVTFAKRPPQKLTSVTLRALSFRGQVDALLATRPGFHGIPTLGFRLERAGDRLTGVCTASVPNVLTLPYRVDMTRVPDSTRPPSAPGDQARATAGLSGTPPVMTPSHQGWRQKRCEQCHGVPVKAHGPATSSISCLTCHGGNGACDPTASQGKTPHSKQADCTGCHKTRHGFKTTPECVACHYATAGVVRCGPRS